MISVIIPVLNSAATLEACFRSVRTALDQCPAQPGEIIFLDNGSTDGSWELMTAFARGDVMVLREPQLTVAGLRNLGAGQAKGELLSFVDADCVLPEEYYREALAVLHETGAEATGCYYSLPPAPAWIERVWDGLHRPASDGLVSFINSGNFFIRREAFVAVGGFRQALVTGEDAELGMRLRRAGFRQFQSRRVQAVHLGNPRTIPQFVRKQFWQARGMFATVTSGEVDRPMAALALHLAAQVIALALLLRHPAHLWPLAVAVSILPATAAVLYRYVRARRVVAPVTSLLLYWLYLWARTAALPLALRDQWRPAHHRSTPESSSGSASSS